MFIGSGSNMCKVFLVYSAGRFVVRPASSVLLINADLSRVEDAALNTEECEVCHSEYPYNLHGGNRVRVLCNTRTLSPLGDFNAD